MTVAEKSADSHFYASAREFFIKLQKVSAACEKCLFFFVSEAKRNEKWLDPRERPGNSGRFLKLRLAGSRCRRRIGSGV